MFRTSATSASVRKRGRWPWRVLLLGIGAVVATSVAGDTRPGPRLSTGPSIAQLARVALLGHVCPPWPLTPFAATAADHDADAGSTCASSSACCSSWPRCWSAPACSPAPSHTIPSSPSPATSPRAPCCTAARPATDQVQLPRCTAGASTSTSTHDAVGKQLVRARCRAASCCPRRQSHGRCRAPRSPCRSAAGAAPDAARRPADRGVGVDADLLVGRAARRRRGAVGARRRRRHVRHRSGAERRDQRATRTRPTESSRRWRSTARAACRHPGRARSPAAHPAPAPRRGARPRRLRPSVAMKLPVLSVADGAEWEAAAGDRVRGRRPHRSTIVRRCVDVVDLLAVAASGQGRAALVAAGAAPPRRRCGRPAARRRGRRGRRRASRRHRGRGPVARDRHRPRRARRRRAAVVASVLVRAVRACDAGRDDDGGRPARPRLRRPVDVDGDPARRGPAGRRAGADAARFGGRGLGPDRRAGAHHRRGHACRRARPARARARCSSTPTSTAARSPRCSGCSTSRPGWPPRAGRRAAERLDAAALAALCWQLGPQLRVLTGIPIAARWPELRPTAIGAGARRRPRARRLHRGRLRVLPGDRRGALLRHARAAAQRRDARRPRRRRPDHGRSAPPTRSGCSVWSARWPSCATPR